MKIEKILALVKMAAEKMEDESERNTYRYALEKDPCLCEFAPTTGAILAYLAHELEEDNRKSAARASGRSSQLKALNAIVSSAKDRANCTELHGTFMAGNARAVCDGFRAVRIKNDSVQMPESAPKGKPLYVDKCFPQTCPDESHCITLPSAAELRARIKEARADFRMKTGKPGTKCPAVWKLSTDLGFYVYINANYLLDMLDALPGAVAYSGNKSTEPIYFSASDGDGVLCPIRLHRNDSYIINEKQDKALENASA